MSMIPVDGSVANDFEGVDFAAYFRGPAVCDGEAATGRVMSLLEDFLKEKGLSSRKYWLASQASCYAVIAVPCHSGVLANRLAYFL